MARLPLPIQPLVLLLLLSLLAGGCMALPGQDSSPLAAGTFPPEAPAATAAVQANPPAAGKTAHYPLPATSTPAIPGPALDLPAAETLARGSPALESPAPAIAPELAVPQPLPTYSPPLATPLPPPYIPAGLPKNRIEIRNLGPLSRVTSPLHVYGYLKTGARSLARIELLGEDGRLLFGETKVFDVPAGARAVLSLDLNFETSAAAEAGRLQIYVQDDHGRVTALNSVPLILLSLGDADIDSPADVLDPIFIQQPVPKALIQGGALLVAGLARAAPEATLLARLIAEDGRELGLRVGGVDLPPEGGYGSFAVEVPYQVDGPTPALLVVSIGEKDNTDIIHLTSLEVLLGP